MSTGPYTSGADGRPEPAGAGTPPTDRTGGTYSNAPSYSAEGAPGTPSPATTPPVPAGGGTGERRVTRAGVIWAAVVAALVLLILLIIFILQNQELVLVQFLGFEGSVPLGMALFIASVTGGVLVAMAGGARILQLRRNANRARTGSRR